MNVSIFAQRLVKLLALVASVVLSCGISHATTFATEEFECPIGGEEFKARVVASNTTFGQRPDGKPYSPLPVYPIVECPENGFLLFDDDFTEEELALLETAIESPEFAEMREADTQHYRASWLKKQAGRDALSQIDSLLQATWETDGNIERKIRYQAAFANTVMTLDRDGEDPDAWFWLNLRAINALRELGHFDKGLTRLDLVTRPEHFPADATAAKNGQYFADQLRALLVDENYYSEPANLVPPFIAIFRCVVPTVPLTAAEQLACEEERIQAEIEEYEFKPKRGKKLKGKAAIRAADAELHQIGH